jgi:peptide chain release factor subunit 1
MISRQDLKTLLSRERKDGEGVLSVYLDVDQGRAVNLNRGFEAAFRSLTQGVEKGLENSQKKQFQEAAKRAGAFLADYQPSGKCIVYFGDAGGDFSWHRSLGVGLANKITWHTRPYIRPLIEAQDEFERYALVLTDRARARLFTIFLGIIEEKHEALAGADVRKFDASGSDQMRSQMSFQRKADEHARWHLKHVAEILDKLSGSERFDRLVLAGTTEAVGELKGLLPDRLRKLVVGSVSLAIDAGEAQILDETIGLLERVERESENAIVEDLLTAAAKNRQAVLGFEGTLQALREGRIRRLVYGGEPAVEGGHCLTCDQLFLGTKLCPNCEKDLHTLDDLLEIVVGKVFQEGGEIEQVRGQASERLASEGEGIGAFLRF